MKSKIAQTITSGLLATGVMTVVGIMAPYMGLPKMNPAEMLAGMMDTSIVVGYLMHFMIGIIFAAGYVFIINPKIHIHSKLVKGLLFGFGVFVFAQIMLFVMSKVVEMPMAESEMLLMMLGSMLGHLVFGVVVASIVPNYFMEQGNK